ncbi:MAG: MFS transporter [Chloroflexi bacterium]|nr:MFS transporter [Chloroflexota bacterium]
MTPTFTLSERTGRWTLFSTILASSMAFIDGTALNVALAALQDDLDATGGELIWIVNGYLLLLASLILLGGSLGDHLGRKRVFGSGIMIFAGASLVCGFAPSTTVLIGARFVQGIGGALMVPGSLAIITALIDSSDRGKAIGTWSAATTITTISGPVLGGVLAGAGLWRFVFFINLPIAALTLYGLSKVPENRDDNASRELDFPGAALSVIGLAGLTYGLVTLGERGIATGVQRPSVWIALAASVVAFPVFILRESRTPHPMVNLNLFRSRTFSGANGITALLYGALSGGLLFLPLNLIQAQGYDAATAGLTFIPFSIMLAILSPWAGGLVDRYGPRLLLTIGPSIVGLSYFALALPGLTDGFADYWLTYFPGVLGIGIGMGLTVAPLTTSVMGAAPTAQSGVASGVNNAVARSAQALSTAIFGALALVAFSFLLENASEDIVLASDARDQLADEANDLGNAEPPDGLAPATEAAVERAIDEAFVDTFRLTVIGAGIMCLLSGALAAVVLRKEPAVDETPGDSAQPPIDESPPVADNVGA